MTWRSAFEEWWRIVHTPLVDIFPEDKKELFGQAFREGFLVGSREVFKHRRSQRAASDSGSGE